MLADRLRAANRTAEERRQEAKMRAEVVNREAEQQAHHEYAAALGRSVPAGNGSGNYPGSSSDLVATLVSMLRQRQNQSQRMLDMMGARLDRLEAERAQGAQGSSAGAPANASAPAATGSGGLPQSGTMFPSEGKLPFGVEIPEVPAKEWKGRHQEILGFCTWMELFCSWLNLISDRYPAECRSALQETRPIARHLLQAEVSVRSTRLLSYLKQAVAGWTRAEALIAHYVSTVPFGEAHGYEAFRKLNVEFGLQNRSEALALRESVLAFTVKEAKLMDIVCAVDTRLRQYQMILDSGFADPTLQGRTADLAIPEADKVLSLLKQLPQQVVLHIQLHGKADTYQSVCETVRNYDLNTRLLDVSKLNAFPVSTGRDGGKAKGKGKKGKEGGENQEKGTGGKGKPSKGDKSGKGKGSGKKGKGSSNRSPSTESQKSPKKLGPCFKCGKDGHLKRDLTEDPFCPSLRSPGLQGLDILDICEELGFSREASGAYAGHEKFHDCAEWFDTSDNCEHIDMEGCFDGGQCVDMDVGSD